MIEFVLKATRTEMAEALLWAFNNGVVIKSSEYNSSQEFIQFYWDWGGMATHLREFVTTPESFSLFRLRYSDIIDSFREVSPSSAPE